MRVEQRTILWLQRYLIRIHFTAILVQQNNRNKFSCGPMISLEKESWPHIQCQVWVPSHIIGFKSNQIVVDYSHNTYAIVKPIYLVVSVIGHRVHHYVRLMISVLLLQYVHYIPALLMTTSRVETSGQTPAQSLHVQWYQLTCS